MRRFSTIVLLTLLLACISALPLVTMAGEIGATNVDPKGDDGFGRDVAVMILSFVGLLTGIAGVLLDEALRMLVIDMGSIINTGFLGAPLVLAWKIVRDLVNLTFIFGLLYAGITMILGINVKAAKAAVASIVIGALLVNFSLFISKVIIDVSNVTAVEIYNTMTANNAMYTSKAWNNVGLSGAFMQQMGLLDIVVTKEGQVAQNLTSPTYSITYVLVGSIFLIIAAFVFAAGALLLTIRFGLLVFLMALSPVAFAAQIVPGVKHWSKWWWSTLINQAFFAPAYLFMLMITWILMARTTAQPKNITAIFTSTNLANAGETIIHFLLIIVGLVASLIIAKKMGAYGAGTALKFGTMMRRSAVGAIGRNTLGRGAGWARKGYEKLDTAYTNSRFSQSTFGKGFNKATSIATFGLKSAADRGIREGLASAEKSKYGGYRNLDDDKKYAKSVKATRSAVMREGKHHSAADDLVAISAGGGEMYGHMSSAELNKIAADARKTLQGMTGHELEELGSDTLVKVAPHLTNKQMDQIKDSKDGFTDVEKGKIKTAREKAQEDSFKKDPAALLKNMKAGDIAKLHVDKILTRPEATPYLTGDVLRRLHDDDALDPTQKQTIVANIQNPTLGAHPSANKYISSPRGQNYYA